MTPSPPKQDPPSADSAPSAARRGAARKRSGATLPTDEAVAQFSAARAFLAGEWFGATLMVASFTLLYLLAFGAEASPGLTYGVCGALLAVGTLAFFRSRAYYRRIGFDVAPRLHGVAAVVAGSAGIFWLLFLLLVALAWMGVAIQ